MVFRNCMALALLILIPAAFGGEIVDGVLMVDGEPFYPLGSWNFEYTSPQDIARVGMNTSFRGGPSTPEAVESFREYMREAADLGIQMVPYLSYGGAMVTPWPPESVRNISKLATEPNLLAWYVGDDIGPRHLPGIEQTVTILREETPNVPAAADYIEEERPDAQKTFTQYIDIRCQYTYPIPDDSYPYYLAFFDKQREFVGDPLWTWVQTFMWGHTGAALNVGSEGPGPVPDPEQVRLLAFSAINRGVRGLLFFAHPIIHRQPELAAEIALVCREVRLVEKHLAAGEPAYNLPTSHPDVNATAFDYKGSTVISAALFAPNYHHWVDEGMTGPFSIDCLWDDKTPPRAFLVATPDVIECEVSVLGDKKVRVTVPKMELTGFILLSDDRREIAALRKGVDEIPEQLRTLVVQAAAVQSRKMADILWRQGFDNLYAGTDAINAMRATERCADAIDARDYTGAFRAWRDALRVCRIQIDRLMKFAESHRDQMTPTEQRFLLSPHSLHNIRGLGRAPALDDPWHFIRQWQVVGPFALDWNGSREEKPAPGFLRVYGPETNHAANAVFDTVDGPAGWHKAATGIDGMLDFVPEFDISEDVVCYARSAVIAPRDMEVEFSLGSNDGARAWVNGVDVFQFSGAPHGRSAVLHQDKFTVKLKKGPNDVLVKVENLGKSWQLYLSVHDPDRELEFRAE
ncbi:MAG: hypothetical protein ABIH23_13815 [bacterium]